VTLDQEKAADIDQPRSAAKPFIALRDAAFQECFAVFLFLQWALYPDFN